MDYIKIKSSYVKQTKHSQVNDGSIIFERDASTIGGINNTNTSQMPVYTSGNFIITVDDSTPVKRKVNLTKWETNGDSEIWTLDNIDDQAESDTSANEENIVLKKDFYRLQDFAYYGSLADLMRVSMTDILSTFPGELYAAIGDENNLGYHVSFDYKSYLDNEDDMPFHTYTLGEIYIDRINNIYVQYPDSGVTYLVSNPFSLNIHDNNKSTAREDIDKYIALNSNWKNYFIIDKNGNSDELICSPIITFSEQYEKHIIDSDTYPLCAGDKLCDVVLSGESISFPISVFLGNDNQIYYLTTKDYLGYHLRPSETLYDDWYNNLSILESYILTKEENLDTHEYGYKSTFEVISEDRDGYYVNQLEDFFIPVDEGGWNINISSLSYSNFVKRMAKIGEFYDNHITNNLYRLMVHESIKNFDWTFTREYVDGQDADFIVGGNRMSNILHLFATEFDELKDYIDAILYMNTVTYDDKNNLPDYFLSDLVDIKGWDITSIIPFSLSEYILMPASGICEDDTKYVIYDDGIVDSGSTDCESGNTVTVDGVEYKLHRTFSQTRNSDIAQPYYPSEEIPYGTFVAFYKSRIKPYEIYNNCPTRHFFTTDCDTYNRILPYYSTKEYTYNDIYNEFLQRLALNSPHIFKHKGTIDGIEAILGMFGLKSERWVNALKKPQQRTISSNHNTDCDALPSKDNDVVSKEDYYTADYKIVEYTSFVQPILDTYNNIQDETWINWYNGTKLINYAEEEDYTGLPIIGYNVISGDTEADLINSKVIYPYFDKTIDGNPYYQMNGGWLNKTKYIFDKDNNILLEGKGQYETLFTETHSSVRDVDDITSIKDFVSDDLNDGDVMYVENFNNYVIINGYDFYQLESEKVYNEDTGEYTTFLYFYYTVTPIQTSIGDFTFSDVLMTSNPNYDYDNNYNTLNLNTLQSNQRIKVYVYGDLNNLEDGLAFYMGNGGTKALDYHYNKFITYFVNGHFVQYTDDSIPEIKTSGDTNYTHYFILHDVNSCNYYDSTNGWEQLMDDDMRYYKINAIIEKIKGNNPHMGHFNYDLGCEYMRYYKNIFKYAYENDLINEDCFDDEAYDGHLEIISSIGFTNLMDKESDTPCPIDYLICKDAKVHSFMNLLTNKKVSGETILNKQKYGTDYHLSDIVRCTDIVDYYYCKDDYDADILPIDTIESVAQKPIIYGLQSQDITDEETQETTSADTVWLSNGYYSRDITHQVINTKRVCIQFYMHFERYSKEDLKEKKYIDDVIMHYVEQMLPSNIICTIDYVYENERNMVKSYSEITNIKVSD